MFLAHSTLATSTALQPKTWVIVMGVAGCGKSTLAQLIADRAGLPFIEGDSFHSAENIRKMTEGVALTDTDRESWLDALGQQMHDHPQGAVLSCSALKRAYRDRLRSAVMQPKFVHIEVPTDLAASRLSARAGEHFFPPSLFASQFAALENPSGEAGVLQVDGHLPPVTLCNQALAWLATLHTAAANSSK